MPWTLDRQQPEWMQSLGKGSARMSPIRGNWQDGRWSVEYRAGMRHGADVEHSAGVKAA